MCSSRQWGSTLFALSGIGMILKRRHRGLRVWELPLYVALHCVHVFCVHILRFMFVCTHGISTNNPRHATPQSGYADAATYVCTCTCRDILAIGSVRIGNTNPCRQGKGSLVATCEVSAELRGRESKCRRTHTHARTHTNILILRGYPSFGIYTSSLCGRCMPISIFPKHVRSYAGARNYLDDLLRLGFIFAYATGVRLAAKELGARGDDGTEGQLTLTRGQLLVVLHAP